MTDSPSEIIRLLDVPGVGPKKAYDLVQHCGSISRVFSAPRIELMKVAGIHAKIAGNILAPVDQELLDGQLRLIDKFGVELITIWDTGYPDMLKEIYDPPVALFCRGDLSLLHEPAIGVVGTRRPTNYGKSMARQLGQDLSKSGLTLVSGAARGIDTIAHQAALEIGGNTIAVLGCGVDRVYPAENKFLMKNLVDQGLVISEFLMGSKPDAPNFPRRNRIISGLSKGIIVVEAAEKSGSLITAYYALDQNREVFSVPGQANSEQSKGTNQLIKQGAQLVASVEDVLAELSERFQMGMSTGQQELIIALDGPDQTVYEQLSRENPMHIDDLAQATGLTTFGLLPTLLKLELKGHVQQLPGKYFKRK